MKHFKVIENRTCEWTTWTKHKVKFKFDNSLENQKIIICDSTEDDSIIVKLNCQWGDYDNFKHLLSELDIFCESSSVVTSEKIAFPSRRFIQNLVDDAYEMLNCSCLISKRDDKIYLSLAFFYLVLSKKNIFPEEYIEDHYDLMNFCRKTVINKFDPDRMSSTDKFITFIHLLCHYWKYTFTKYSKYFTKHDPENEVWKIISDDCASDEPDWYKSKLYQFWGSEFWETNAELKNKFLLIIKDFIKWFSTERYNLPAMNRLIDVQKDLEAELNKKEKSDNNNKQNKNSSRKSSYWEKMKRWLKNQIAYKKPMFILIWMFIIMLLEAISQDGISKYLLSLTFLGIILFICWYTIKFFFLQDTYWFKKLIPRLFGTIIVGYVPLIIQDNVWEFCLNIQWYVALQIAPLSIFASWLFMFVKISKSVNDKKKVIERAGRVILLGLAESLVIGLVLCSLFSSMLTCKNSEPFFKISREIDVPFLFGFFNLPIIHVVYPSILFVYFSLALFIGVFLQLFWEEKPITEEL